MTSRRTFLSAIAAALVLDPERALWVPGAKTISIPKPPFLAVGDIVEFGAWPGESYIVTVEARSIETIGDAQFRIHHQWPPGSKLRNATAATMRRMG